MRNSDRDANIFPRIVRFPEKQNAFTLVELLVAIVILAILTLLLCGILNQVSSAWSQIRAQIDWHQNGRSILNVIASELRVAALPNDRSNLNSLQLMVDPPVLLGSASHPYLNAHAIFWQAPIATDASSGNEAEVGYFVRWDQTKANNPHAILCRFFVNPSDSNYLIYSQPTAWLTTSLLDSVAPGTASITPSQNYKGWFADNVIGLWVRCLDANGVPIIRTAADITRLSTTDTITTNYSFDSRLGYIATNAGATGTYIAKSAYYETGSSYGPSQEYVQCALPSTIEVAIVVIDSQTANHVTAIPSYTAYNTSPTLPSGVNSPVSPYTSAKNSPVDFWNDINFFLANLKTAQPLVAQGAHVYSIRVPLVNGG